MFRFRILVSICFFVGVVGCLVFNKTDQFSSPPAGDASFSVPDRATRDVVFQDAAQSPADEGSMLPEALRGFWGKGKQKPGIDGEDTMKWANETYEALKSKGLTTASNAGSWLTQDFKNMNAWEYKVVFIPSKQPADAEKALNQLGADRWECFHVQPSASSLMFYFKKPKRSYLRSLPTSDLMRLVPMMGGE